MPIPPQRLTVSHPVATPAENKDVDWAAKQCVLLPY